MSLENTSFDLCIIGTGPAGIIVALEYSKLNPSKKILLVEFGAKNSTVKNKLDDAIHIANPINHHDPYECTNKQFGGTSASWGGRCVMYDEVDFIDRPSLNAGCTWDLTLLNEVRPFIGAAAEYFECGEPIFDLNQSLKTSVGRISEKFIEGVVSDTIIERYSSPTRFGVRYSNELRSNKNITILEDYEARDFTCPEEKTNHVKCLTIRNVHTFVTKEITAACFVIAAGALESTRILLRNPHLFQCLDSPPNALGRYYQGHLSGKIATLRFNGDPSKTDFGFRRDEKGVYIRRRFQFSKEYLVENDLLNTAIWLDNPLYVDPSHKSGSMSFMYLAMILPFLGKKLAPPAVAFSITKGKVYGIKKHIWNVIKDFPGSLITPARIFYHRYLKCRKLPGVFLFSPQNSYALHFHAEQIPLYENRMELADDGETLKINYQLTDTDIDSVIKLHKTLDTWLRKIGAGFLEYWYPEDQLLKVIREMSKDGIHQNGTTRISESSDKGVVDKDLKVWGTENVYVCSSSVFPTSSQANPTFFLGAFAARLANHISRI